MLSFFETVFKKMTQASPGKAPTEALSGMGWHGFDKAIVIN